MAEDPKQEPESQTAPENDDAEKNFWDKFDSRLEGKLNSWFDNKMKDLKEQGTSRTGGRNTLPKIIAGLMGGPFDPQNK